MTAQRKNPSKPKLKAKASRGGGMDGPLQPSGLSGSKGASKSLAKKQIRWHHGAAAFVLKYIRDESRLINGGAIYVFHFRRDQQMNLDRNPEDLL